MIGSQTRHMLLGLCVTLGVASAACEPAKAQSSDSASLIAKETALALKASRHSQIEGSIEEAEESVQRCYKDRSIKSNRENSFKHVVYCMQMDYFGYLPELPFPDGARQPYFTDSVFSGRRAALLAAVPARGLR